METIAVNDFKDNLLEILKKIEHGSIFTITLQGKPIARLIPPEINIEKARESLKALQKTAIIKDVISPIDVEWEALK
jgi:antitoxin (DNA-binding transcriptional repressor) of toxin-antitoxin stability system